PTLPLLPPCCSLYPFVLIILFFLFFRTPPPPTSPLFPYTTLFRSRELFSCARRRAAPSRRTTRPPRASSDRGTPRRGERRGTARDRKSTRLNSSHQIISYAVFCLTKKKKEHTDAIEILKQQGTLSV